MKSLRKSFLTLLALTLFGGAGAWAQTVFTTLQEGDVIHVGDQFNPTQNFLITQNSDYLVACMPSGNAPWTLVRANITGQVTESETGAYFLFRANNGSYYFTDENDRIAATENSDGLVVTSLSTMSNWPMAIVAVHEAEPAEIELTPSNNNHTWTLEQAPDYDLELQVEYYEAHALKDIPEGWTVMVNGVEQQTPYQGDSLMIVETDSVTLVPAGNPRRVKSVTLEDEGPATQTVNIGGVELQIAEGDTWAQIIARNPTKIEDFQGWVERADGGGVLWDANDNFVNTSDPYDPSQQSYYHWVGI